jgi:hypothetical protein
MKLAYFTSINGQKIAIPIDKITGFTEVHDLQSRFGDTFIATGAEGSDGDENGWYVVEKFETVKAILQSL